MFTFLTILFCLFVYLFGAAATNGYSKHRWPEHIIKKRNEYGSLYDWDENGGEKIAATLLWPFYWMLVWPCITISSLTFNKVEKRAGHRVAMNKARIAELSATRLEVEKSNSELEAAEQELDKEIARGL